METKRLKNAKKKKKKDALYVKKDKMSLINLMRHRGGEKKF